MYLVEIYNYKYLFENVIQNNFKKLSIFRIQLMVLFLFQIE